MSSAAPRRTPRDSPAPGPVEHRSVASNGHRFHVAQAGPADGPLVLLLHGFPEFWYGWS